MIRYLKILLSPFDSEGVSQYSVIASDRRERGDLSCAIASVTRDCHVAALLVKTVYGAYVVNIHDYDTASPLRVTMLVEYRGEKTPTFAAFK